MAQGFTRQSFIANPALQAGPPGTVGLVGDSNLLAGARDGVAVTPAGSANTLGSFIELIASTPFDTFGLWVRVGSTLGTGFNGANLAALINIATGAGGSESIIIANLDAGSKAPYQNTIPSMGSIYYFPSLFIPSGTRLSAQAQSATASRQFTIALSLDGGISFSDTQTSVVTYGANTASSIGTSIAPGNDDFGSWVEIGTTSRDHRIWTVGYDLLGDTTVITARTLIEIAHGPDTDTLTIIGRFLYSQDVNELLAGPFPPMLSGFVASGTKLWARVSSAETENRGVIIYGV